MKLADYSYPDGVIREGGLVTIDVQATFGFLSCKVGLSSFESVLVNSQGRDF